MKIALEINGHERTLEIMPHETLLAVLRREGVFGGMPFPWSPRPRTLMPGNPGYQPAARSLPDGAAVRHAVQRPSNLFCGQFTERGAGSVQHKRC